MLLRGLLKLLRGGHRYVLQDLIKLGQPLRLTDWHGQLRGFFGLQSLQGGIVPIEAKEVFYVLVDALVALLRLGVGIHFEL